MAKTLLVNYEKYDQDVFIDNDDVYVNHTGDSESTNQRFIHNTCELLFVEEGEAEYLINGARYLVAKNGILIIGANDVHSCQILKTPYVRYGLYFMPRYLATLPMIRGYMDVYRTPSLAQAEHLRGIPRQQFDELCEMVNRIWKEERSQTDDSKEMRNALTWEMTILLKRLLKTDRDLLQSSAMYSAMMDIRLYIDSHFSEDCSLNNLSRMFFLQPTTISRNFSHTFGETIGNYITLVRISNAVRLLEQGHESVTEIANRVGYNNVNTFIRAFAKMMQTSPLQYRKAQAEFRRQRSHYELGL